MSAVVRSEERDIQSQSARSRWHLSLCPSLSPLPRQSAQKDRQIMIHSAVSYASNAPIPGSVPDRRLVTSSGRDMCSLLSRRCFLPLCISNNWQLSAHSAYIVKEE